MTARSPSLKVSRPRPRVARAALRDGVREAIYQRILRSGLEPGRSIGEIALGHELGASRTPLREALIELQSEGVLEHDPGRGFVVRPLSAAELREIYPIVAALDSLAVELAPKASAALTKRLRAINVRFRAASRAQRVALDTEWHDTLASAGANDRLSTVLRTLRRVIQRYERAYMSDETLVRRSAHEHETIVSALSRGDRAGAARRLREHWNGSIERLIALLETNR
jgi:DNA-binding GntR family transcriptional regulator